MKALAQMCVFALLFCLTSGSALAHRVNIFAYVDGDAVQVECSFSRSQKVRAGKLSVSDAVNGELLLEGVTDDQGRFRFTPPEHFVRSGHDMLLSLNAGEGHKNDWTVSAQELAALTLPGGARPEPQSEPLPEARSEAQLESRPQSQPQSQPESGDVSPEPAMADAGRGRVQPGDPGTSAEAAGLTFSSVSGVSAAPGGVSGMTEAEMEALVGRVVEARLAPVKHALGELTQPGPGVRDIVGGLGWIIGLLGLASYMKYRR